MLIHELHTALSRSLGDPVAYNAGGSTRTDKLVDGVRYTVAIRDQYLTQAMRDIQLSVMNQIVTLPRDIASEILSRSFPTSTQYFEWDSSVDGLPIPSAINTKILWIYSVSLTSTSEGNLAVERVVVPILNAQRAVMIAHGRTPDQPPDNVAVVYSNNGATDLRLYQVVEAEPVIEIAFLPKAVDVSTLADTATITFEEIWLQQVIIKASLYGQLDSQELGVASQAAPLLMQGSIPIQGGR